MAVMRHISESFVQKFDRDSRAVFQDLEFENCIFDNCALSLVRSPDRRSTVRNVRITSCTSFSCDIGPAIFDTVYVSDLSTRNDFLRIWSPVFRHVTLEGSIGEILINAIANVVDWSPDLQRPFDLAREEFYSEIDWALDISKASFDLFEMRGIPTRLIRRDPATQFVVTRRKALCAEWRTELSDWNDYWPQVINLFLEDGDEDLLLVAPKGEGPKEYRKLLRGLEELRRIGVAEPD